MLDLHDSEILNARVTRLLYVESPKQGDFVRFADVVLRRISHVWLDENGSPDSIQTSDGGSFYLGDGYLSFSGSLFTSVYYEHQPKGTM